MIQSTFPGARPPVQAQDPAGRPIRRSLAFALMFALALPAGCGSVSNGGARSPVGLLASGPRPAEVVAGGRPARGPGKVPEEVLRDPAERMRFRERMRVQILHRTGRLSPAEYDQRVRARLARQLEAMGLHAEDVELILADVDRSRSAEPHRQSGRGEGR
jgi:hypothetical protein